MKQTLKKVLIGLSGGVDSSIAAYLLKKDNYDVIGITMKIWDGSIDIHESGKHSCYGPGEKDDIEAAAEVCKSLNIPYFVCDLEDEYKKYVLDYFRSEYRAGRTPNPCVRCNQIMKFGFMLESAKKLGIDYDYFATGHYAQIKKMRNGDHLLEKAADKSKDQTYFLYTLTKKQLENILFPLGNLTKFQVRKIAKEIGLNIAEKPESQDFFAGDYSLLFNKNEFIPGNIIDSNGTILGIHKGIVHYTIGQRKGLGINSKKPMYVINIDATKNTIIVGEKKDLFSKGLIAIDVNFLDDNILEKSCNIKAKIRQMHDEADAVLYPIDKQTVKVIFNVPQMAVTPGQSVVFYKKNIIIGGGIIDSAIKID